MRDARRDSERGLTLTELMVALAMMSILLGAVMRYAFSTQQGLLKQEASAELLTRSGRINSNLRAGLNGVRLLLADYGGAPDFSAYRSLVRSSIAAQPGTPQPAPFTLPPVVTNARYANLGATNTAERAHWGNELLFLATLQPLTLTVKFATSPSPTAQSLSLDRVQFVYIYPALVSLNRGGQAQALRLTEWRSQPFILYGSLSESTGQRLSKTCEALVDAGYTWAYDLDQATEMDQIWYQVKDSGSPLLVPDAGGPGTLPQAYWAYVDEYDFVGSFHARPGLDQGRVARTGGGAASGPANFILAFNTVDPATEPQWRSPKLSAPGKALQVPAYAQAGRGGQPSFPGGFEVAILGKPQARELVLRHVLSAVGAIDPRADMGRRAYEGLDFVAVKNDY